MHNNKQDLVLARKLNIAATIISVAVLILVALMRRVKLDLGIDFGFLPPIHAALNAATFVTLIASLYQIKQQNMVAHRRLNFLALGFSATFLLCYVLYHFTTPETPYCEAGIVPRGVYFFILLTHIFLAATSLPFILYTFIRGYTYQFAAHKRMARWVYWVWLYVAFTGPLVYLMLRPCYQ